MPPVRKIEPPGANGGTPTATSRGQPKGRNGPILVNALRAVLVSPYPQPASPGGRPLLRAKDGSPCERRHDTMTRTLGATLGTIRSPCLPASARPEALVGRAASPAYHNRRASAGASRRARPPDTDPLRSLAVGRPRGSGSSSRFGVAYVVRILGPTCPVSRYGMSARFSRGLSAYPFVPYTVSPITTSLGSGRPLAPSDPSGRTY